MNINVSDELALAAAELQRRDPNGWTKFMAAFEKYNQLSRDGLIKAPPENILIAQGKAKQCGELATLLSDCINIANRLAQAKK